MNQIDSFKSGLGCLKLS